MGCGCKERKERWANGLEAKGQPTLARVLRMLPSPGDPPVLRATQNERTGRNGT